jgi:DNA polymerase-3 subunit epsilon
MGFINHELEAIGHTSIPYDQAVDTLMLARRRHPGGPNSLDALCERYGIDNSHRDKHGALLDAELLAEVYVELIGGRQAALSLVETGPRASSVRNAARAARPVPLKPRVTEAERAAHTAFVSTLGPDAIWRKYREFPEE